MGKRKIKVAAGDVFTVPLLDGTQAIAQVIEVIDSLGAALCAFYSYRVGPDEATSAFAFARSEIVTVQPMSLRRLVNGEWPILRNLPVAHGDLRRVLDGVRASGFVGLVIADGNAMKALMNAHHGLASWEIGSDRDFLRRLVHRP